MNPGRIKAISFQKAEQTMNLNEKVGKALLLSSATPLAGTLSLGIVWGDNQNSQSS